MHTVDARIDPVDKSVGRSAGRVTVPFMTQMRVDGAAIRTLGEALLGVADDLATVPAHAGAAEGLPPGRARGALDTLLGNWMQVRHQTARQVADLGQAAVAAGAAYVEVETATVQSLVSGQDAP